MPVLGCVRHAFPFQQHLIDHLVPRLPKMTARTARDFIDSLTADPPWTTTIGVEGCRGRAGLSCR